MKLDDVYDLPTVLESERETAKDIPAATAYVRRFGFDDEADMLAALNLGSLNVEPVDGALLASLDPEDRCPMPNSEPA